MSKGLALIGAALLCFCCASIGVRGDVVQRPGLAEAVDFVWREQFERRDAPPTVRIVEGADLNCTDTNSGKAGFVVLLEDESRPGNFMRACREGFTFLPTEVSVAWHGEPWSRTALAHELAHVRLVREGVFLGHHPGPDPKAWRPEFRPGGDVDQANAKLEAVGR